MEKPGKNYRKYILPATMLVVGMIIGWIINSSPNQPIDTSTVLKDHQHNESEVWTCSMHPQIRQPEAGKCPICGMDLIPLNVEEGNAMEVNMSSTAMELANIQTIVVGGQKPMKEIRLNGKVQVDERLISSQTSHIPGRIEQLLINFTGETVRKGQVIANVYSPELVTAQQELLEAKKIKDAQPALFIAAKEKLKNWKLSDTQIEHILQSGKAEEVFPLHADFSGVVLEKKVSVGDHVMQGATLYDIANLSRVWVLFDVYENDMGWVKTNDVIDFTIQSLPGETFRSKITFIDPIINPQTRVATARIEVNNSAGKLKPEMFASAIVKSDLKKQTTDIVVPKSAVMWTGERSIVYVKHTSDNGIHFTLREVTLGPSLGDSYLIKAGLESGEEIASHGTFSIDAAAQLAGKPSMMNPTGGSSPAAHDHSQLKPDPANSDKEQINPIFQKQIGDMLPAYLQLKDAFVSTNAKLAATHAKQMLATLNKVNMKLASDTQHDLWMNQFNAIEAALTSITNSSDIEAQRTSFSTITTNYYDAIQHFQVHGLNAYYQYCPMAFNNTGGYWISNEKEIKNPYFGSKMMRCGETKSKLN